MIDKQPFRDKDGRSVSKVAKYTVKNNDYLVKSDFKLTDKTVSTLYSSLSNRRLVAFGKLMKEAHKELNLSKIDDDSDLVI